jgi:hypothetical protein
MQEYWRPRAGYGTLGEMKHQREDSSMRTKLLVTMLAIAVAAPTIAQAPAPDPLAVAEGRIISAWESLESARGVLHIAANMDVENITLPAEAAGPFAYKVHEGQRLFRVDLDGDVTAPEISPTGALPIQLQGVFDGAVGHVMTNMLFQKTVLQHKPSQKDLAVGGDALFRALHKDCNVRLAAEKNVNGAPSYVIEAVVKDPGEELLDPAKWVVCFAKDSGLPIVAQAFDKRGRVIFKSVMTDVVLNPVLNLARFSFVMPPDARLVKGDDVSQLIPIPR